MGWSEASEANGQTTALTGAASGMACIYLSTEILKRVSVSSPQAAVLHSTTYWGAWYGYLAANLAGENFENDQRRVLGTMLWGSSGGLAAGVLWALNDHADPGASG